nr:hypothetical protein Itr_chr12CG07670 [Ipomoea trifida]
MPITPSFRYNLSYTCLYVHVSCLYMIKRIQDYIIYFKLLLTNIVVFDM